MSIMSEHEVYPLGEGDTLELKVEAKRKRVPYEKILRLLAEGHEVFIEVDRKMASYIRRRLEEKAGAEIEIFPSKFRHMEGYTFKFSLVHEVLKKWER